MGKCYQINEYPDTKILSEFFADFYPKNYFDFYARHKNVKFPLLNGLTIHIGVPVDRITITHNTRTNAHIRDNPELDEVNAGIDVQGHVLVDGICIGQYSSNNGYINIPEWEYIGCKSTMTQHVYVN